MFFKLDALFDNPGQPALNIFLAMELGQKDHPRGYQHKGITLS